MTTYTNIGAQPVVLGALELLPGATGEADIPPELESFLVSIGAVQVVPPPVPPTVDESVPADPATRTSRRGRG